MARYVTKRDHLTRTQWAEFLEPLIGDERPISALSLAKAMSAFDHRRGDATWQVYDWLEGERTVTADRAFYAGEALRELGVAWCSGAIGLYAAGYLKEFYCVIGVALCRGADPELAALLYHARTAVRRDWPDSGWFNGNPASRREKQVQYARKALAAATDPCGALSAAWQTVQAGSEERHLSDAFKGARKIAAIPELDLTLREKFALEAIDDSLVSGLRFHYLNGSLVNDLRFRDVAKAHRFGFASFNLKASNAESAHLLDLDEPAPAPIDPSLLRASAATLLVSRKDK